MSFLIILHMLSKKQSYIKGAMIISVGGFISKILGAVYRIPLANFIGGEGMGIYQMVYPLYCILLTVSASGIPTGIARLISSGKRGAERSGLILYGTIGVIGMLLMFLLSTPLSILQGESEVKLSCIMLSPSVFFVSVLSVIRGYFQGKGNMYPTAITEVSEQLIKVIIGCFLAYFYRNNLNFAVASTLFAVTVSEGISTMVAVHWYFKKREITPLYSIKRVPYSAIIKYTLPLTFTAIAIPFSQLCESIVAVNILRKLIENPTALYGVFSGCAVTIVSLPISITYGLAVASIPQIAPLAERGDYINAKKRAYKSILMTFIISLPASICLFIFSPFATKLIFSSLSAGEKAVLDNLVKIMSINAVTLSIVQTSSACLTALGYPIKSTITQWITAILRIVLTAILIKYTPLSIQGAAISANCSYLVACLLNICYIIRVNKAREDKQYENNFNKLRRMRRGLDETR